TSSKRDWSSDVCSSDLKNMTLIKNHLFICSPDCYIYNNTIISYISSNLLHETALASRDILLIKLSFVISSLSEKAGESANHVSYYTINNDNHICKKDDILHKYFQRSKSIEYI